MKLKSTDLRVGNWVNRKYYNPEPNNEHWALEPCLLCAININGFNVKLKNGGNAIVDYLEAIPLTEEWLVKFGFKCEFKSRIHCIYTFNNLHYYIWYLEAKEYADFKGAEIKCKFVHQLQNIIHALSGQEL